MSSIGTQIELNDMMTAPLMHITNAINMTISSFEEMQAVSNRTFNSSNFDAVRAEINSANMAMDKMTQNIQENDIAQKKFNQTVKDGTVGANGLFSAIQKIGTMMGAYVGLVMLKEQAKQAIDFASDLTEVQNVVDVTFGKASDDVSAWSKTTLNAFGLNELTTKQYVGTMGAMLKSSGLAGNAVVNMSKGITGLTGDMASFYNLDANTAFEKIRSGISGETEPLKQLGINMSVANLEAFALSQGIKTSYQDMSQASQVMLRYNYLMSVTADAQGDFSRTQDSFANQTKLLSENWKQFTGTLASYAIPTLKNMVTSLNNFILNAQAYIPTIVSVFSKLWDILQLGYDIIKGVAGFFIDNWSMISPIIYGVVAALTIYVAYLAVMNAIELVSNGIKIAAMLASYAHAAATGAEASATAAATAAQYGLNTALLASPITWIIVIIIALISIFYAAVAAINHFAGTSLSATGMIAGAFLWLMALLGNLVIGTINSLIQFVWTLFVEPFIGIIEWILNAANGGFDSFGDAVANLIGNVISWFLSLGKVVTKIIDAIFGTDWTGGLESLQDKVLSWGKNDKAITIDRNAPGIDYRFDMTDAYNKGNDWGNGLEDYVKDFINPQNDKNDKKNNQQNTQDTNSLYNNIANTADNTGKMAKAVNISDEDLKYLHEVAERDSINRFTTAQIKVEMVNHNNISNDGDIDGMIGYLRNEVEEQMSRSAEGVN